IGIVCFARTRSISLFAKAGFPQATRQPFCSPCGNPGSPAFNERRLVNITPRETFGKCTVIEVAAFDAKGIVSYSHRTLGRACQPNKRHYSGPANHLIRDSPDESLECMTSNVSR